MRHLRWGPMEIGALSLALLFHACKKPVEPVRPEPSPVQSQQTSTEDVPKTSSSHQIATAHNFTPEHIAAMDINASPLFGELYQSGENFAVFNPNARQVAFFQIPAGTVMGMESADGVSHMFVPSKRTATGKMIHDEAALALDPYFWARSTYSLCRRSDVRSDRVCVKPIYPTPLKVIKSKTLSMMARPGVVHDSKLILLSTEHLIPPERSGLARDNHPMSAIYDLAGNLQFELPEVTRSSTSYVFALGIDVDAPAAIFGIGGIKPGCHEGMTTYSKAFVTVVLLWTPGDGLKRVGTRERTPAIDGLMKRFQLPESMFYFYSWPNENPSRGCGRGAGPLGPY